MCIILGADLLSELTFEVVSRTCHARAARGHFRHPMLGSARAEYMLDEDALDEELRTANTLCEQLIAQIAARAQQQAQEQEYMLDEDALDEELRTANSLCEQLIAQIAADEERAREQEQEQDMASEMEQRSDPGWDAPLMDDEDADYDRCGTWGCLLPEKHSGLHQTAEPEGRRPRNPVLRYGYLQRTVPQQPNLAARRASVAALHRAEVAAEDEAEGRGDPEIDDDAEDDVGAGAGHATDQAEAENPAEVVAPGFTDSMRVTKLRADYAAWLVAIGKKAGVRGGSQFAQKFIVSLDHESPCLSDSRLSLMSTYRESGLTRLQLMPNGADSYSKVERFQYLVEQQPDCMDMDGDAVHGRWFWPIDHAWIFGEPDKPQGWTTSLLSIVAIRFRSMILTDHVRLITGICDNPQPAGCYVNYADWIRMWNKSYGFCPFCNRDIWIGFDEECNDEDVPPEGQKATIQRLKNSIIHLRSNCHATLICHDCNSNDPTRYDM